MKKHPIFIFLIGTLLLKIIMAAFAPVVADEAYYYIWSLHPQLSYFDHPAMVSWFIYVGHLFFPYGHAISLRIIFVFASFLTSLIWIRLLREQRASDSTILGFLILMFLNPLLGPGSILATPDTPLVLFWSLSYYGFVKVLATHARRWYLFLGMALGLGFCAKYHIVLFVFSGLIYLVLSRKFMNLRPIGVLCTVLMGAIFSLPVVVWNAQNEWSSFLFQINHGFNDDGFDWMWSVNYVLTQILLLNPFVFYYLFRRSADRPEQVFTWAQLAFFFSSSLKSVVEANWPITSHLHATRNFSEQTKPGRFRFALIYWGAIYILIFGYLWSPFSVKVRKNIVNSTQTEELIPLLDKYQPLYGPSYQIASLLSWQTHRLVPKLSELSRHDFFDSLPETKPTAKVFYVLKNDYSDWPVPYQSYHKIKLEVFDKLGLELYQLSYE